MSDHSNEKKKKFLKPVGIAIAALLSVTASFASTSSKDANNPANTLSDTIQQSTKSLKQPLLIMPSVNKGKESLAGHYSHSSHSSHRSHASHYSSSR